MKLDERQWAVTLLLQMEREKSYSNLLLRQKLPKNEPRFAARVTALVYGVLERKRTLEHLVKVYTQKPPEKLDDEVRLILMLGFYQLLYQDTVPDNAAVNEAVALCVVFRKGSAKGMVNAVLRRFVREGKEIVYPKDPLLKTAVRYSVPEWLVRRWRKAYGGEEAEKLLAASFGPAPLTIRVNTLKTDAETVKTALEKQGVTVNAVKGFPNALILSHTGNLEKLAGFQEGAFYVQDLSSQICAEMTGARPGDVVYDLCAAPGSKSFTMAQLMENKGTLCSYDQYEHKISLMREGADKYGITCMETAIADAAVFDAARPMADVVLCDVPCGGLGIIRRKPEIKYKEEKEIDALAPLQAAILETGARYVKPGGRLLYSTCSLNPVENEAVATAFLARHPEFRPAPLPDFLQKARVDGSMVTIFPHHFGSDGFFFAVFDKTL